MYVYIQGKLSYENIYLMFIRILLKIFINPIDYYLYYFYNSSIYILNIISLQKTCKSIFRFTGSYLINYPIDPSISNEINLFNSTAYSIGSSFVNGSTNPMTIISVASDSLIPLLIK